MPVNFMVFWIWVEGDSVNLVDVAQEAMMEEKWKTNSPGGGRPFIHDVSP
jgi:hypothetical protein